MKLAYKFVLLLLLLAHIATTTVSASDPENKVSNPLPSNFIDHNEDNDHVPVHKDKVISLLLGNLKGAAASGSNDEDCDGHEALKQLEAAASDKLKNPGKVQRFVRAVTEKLNASCNEINKISTALASSPEHADRLRRAAEDAAVVGAGQPRVGGGGMLFPGGPSPFFGTTGPSTPPPLPFRFGGGAQNPFFTVPMTSEALEMDLDRLLFIATPILGISEAFKLVRTLHLLHSPRSEVFSLQEQFQSHNLTSEQATQLLQSYETKLSSSSSTTTPSSILQNTAHLSGLNSTEASRFARAISSTVGPLNSTQAMQIHNALSDGGLNKSELIGITNEIEKLQQGETTTPDGATGHDWIFSGSNKKRSLLGGGLSGAAVSRMFSSSRACGFAINTKLGTVFPWMVTVSCNNLLCSGTLVSSTTVVIAADCVLACGNEPVKVLIGDARVVVQPIEIYAQSAVVHPRYTNDNNPAFNMALIHLSTSVDFNENPMVNPICLLYSETDDPDIQCEVVMCNGAGHVPSEQPLLSRSPVLCYQPDNSNQMCSTNGLMHKSTACVSLKSCFPIHTQKSSPVICNRRSRPLRYYLWAVTTPDHSSAKCFNGVARISDSTAFIQSGLL